ncbi:MAG: AAA family ATPase [Roseiflexus sp.]|nr:AAA family ATPase [Roseiflexus sp.]MCS7289128.1 AAA family ATPase [Roseiflexus sp.]MDW8233144.1 BTAD domain-containing putative transcriptional regulator [Roseiflexaceae bacterium]
MEEALRIALFGTLTVQVNGRPLPDSAWRSRQERRLLALLIAARGRVIAADRLCEWLWPGSDSAGAAVNLRSAISSLRRVLEPEADRASRRYILTRPGGYAWNVESGARIDVEEFLALTEPVPTDDIVTPRRELERLERAVALYRGDFLEDEQELAWIVLERERLRARYLTALRRLAEIKLERGDPTAATALAERGIAIAPLSEPLWRVLMLAQARAGDTAGALQSYERYRHLLDHELGAAPSSQTQALHTAILRGDFSSGLHGARAPEYEGQDRPLRMSEARSTTVPVRAVRPLRSALPIVGRQEELASLRRWLADLDQRRGGIVTIVGEAGIGKTRLLAETLRIAADRGAITLELRAMPLEQGLPFAAISETLRSLVRNAPEQRLRQLPQFALAQIADLFPALRERLPDLPELPDVPPDERRNRQIDGLCELALSLARALPLVIALDDAQWADEATLATIGRLARQAPRQAILIILAYRSDELSDNPALHSLLRTLGRDMLLRPLVLSRLDSLAVAELLAGLAGVERGRVAHLAPRLASSTGGNPLALVVTVQALLESRGATSLAALLPDLEAGAPFPDPTEAPQMRELVRARLDRLPSTARDLAEHLALINRPVSLDLIERLGGASALEAAQMLLERQILVEDDDAHLSFNHDLVRSITAATLSSPRRRLLHYRIGEAMAALEGHIPERAAEIAFHFRQAGRTADRETLRYATDAGDYARRAFGYRNALQHYDAAIEAGERLGDDAPIEVMQRAFAGRLLTCETLLDWNGLEETSARYQRWAARRGVTPPTLVAPRRLVLLRALMGDLAGAAAISAAHAPRTQKDGCVEPLPAIADMLRRTALILQPDTLSASGRSRVFRRERRGEDNDPPSLDEDAVSRETRGQDGQSDELPYARDADAAWQAFPSFAMANAVPGNPAEELPELLGPDEAAAALFQIGWAALMQGLLHSARPCLLRSYALAVETGQAPAAVVSALQLAHLNALAGKLDETTIWLERSLETAARASEAAWASIWPRIHQGFLWLLDDRLAQAEQRFVEMAARLAGAPAFQSHRASIAVGMGMIALARGDLAGADVHFHEALRVPHQLYGFIYVSAHHGIARLAALRDDLPRARAVLLHALRYSAQRALLPEYVRTVIEVARIERDFGDPAPVISHLRVAARLARDAGLAPLASAASALSTRLEESRRVP